MPETRRFTPIEMIMIVVILGILAVVAVPRYITMQNDARAAAAEAYIGTLNSALSSHATDHYLRGIAWVKNGREAMALLRPDDEMPDGLSFSNDVWVLEGSDKSWKFFGATGDSSPRLEFIGRMGRK